MKIKSLSTGELFQTKLNHSTEWCRVGEVIAHHDDNLTTIRYQDIEEDSTPYQTIVSSNMEVYLEQLCTLCLHNHQVICRPLLGMWVVEHEGGYHLADDYHSHKEDFLISWDVKPYPEPYPWQEMDPDSESGNLDRARYELDCKWNDDFDESIKTTVDYTITLVEIAIGAGWNPKEDLPFTKWIVDRAGKMIQHYEQP